MCKSGGFLQSPVSNSQQNSVRLERALEEFMLALQVSGRSQKTIRLYQRSIKPLVNFLGNPDLNVSPSEIRAFIAHMQITLNPTTVGIRWRSIRAFFNWLDQEGWLESNPVNSMRSPKVPKKYPDVLDANKMERLVSAARESRASWVGNRNLVIVALLLDCGLRVSELSGICIEDLNLGYAAITVTGKGTRDRQVYFGRRLARLLRAWLEKRTLSLPGNALFCSRQGYPLTRHTIAHIVKGIAVKAKLGDIKCTPHTLRHTFAT